MGRELKRVPLKFNWPLNKIWEGFVNPFYDLAADCPACKGNGFSKTYKELEARWYGYVPFKPEERGSIPFTPEHKGVRAFAELNCTRNVSFYGAGETAIQREAERLCELFNSQWSHHLNADDVAALLKAGRLMDFTHVWTAARKWIKIKPAVIPTPQQVNEWSLVGFGHDSTNCYVVCKAECARLREAYICPQCQGEARLWPTPKVKRQYNCWRPKQPPKGVGYQLWETVSEGSPISPVFATPEELAEWLSTRGNGWSTDQGTTREQWLKFINGPGWAPSFIGGDGKGLRTGVQAV